MYPPPGHPLAATATATATATAAPATEPAPTEPAPTEPAPTVADVLFLVFRALPIEDQRALVARILTLGEELARGAASP